MKLNRTKLTDCKRLIIKSLPQSKTSYVKNLRLIASEFKSIQGLDTEVIFLDSFTSKLLIPGSAGFFDSKTNAVVIFVSGDKEFDTETVVHELIHAYQYKYMNDQYRSSIRDLYNGKVEYEKSWHESHAYYNSSLILNTKNLDVAL